MPMNFRAILAALGLAIVAAPSNPAIAQQLPGEPAPTTAAELLDPPQEVQYLTWASGGLTSYPMWVSIEAAAPDGETLVEQWFYRSSISALQYFLSRPEEPETGCTVVDVYWDVYGGLKSPETAKLVARVKVLHSEVGFGWGSPGTLFRGEVIEILKAQKEHEGRQILDFFAPVGRIPFADRILCPRDPRFPHLEVGDEAIVLVSQIFAPDEPLVGIGEGGVLGIRKGEVLAEGAAFDRLGLATVEDVESRVRAAEIGSQR